jgi:photosystem II stability/assembly factor-like uncharacterized protein
LVGASIVVLIVGGFVYLRPSSGTRSPPASPAPTPQPALNYLEWTSAQNGWLVMQDASLPRSSLFRTTDGGRHWQRLRSTEDGFLAVSFVDSRHGVLQVLPDAASVDPRSQRMFQTYDGGSHWVPMPLPNDVHLAVRAEFVDARHGWLTTNAPIPNFDLANPPPPPDFELWRSDDWGQHWQLLVETDGSHPVSRGILEQDIKLDVWFADPQRGWFEALRPDGTFGMYTTRDGGQSWVPTALPAPPGGWTGQPIMASPPQISGDGQGALVVTDLPRAPGTPSLASMRKWVLSSRDAGETWSNPVALPAAPPPPGAQIMMSSPTFTDGRNGWWVAGGRVWVSGDSGRSWKRAVHPAGWSFRRVFPVNGKVAWADASKDWQLLGPSEPWRLYVTHDSGRHWQRAQVPPVV